MTFDVNDIEEIACALETKYPNVDNINLRFTDLRNWIASLEELKGINFTCNERKLEAIQQAWIIYREENISK